MDGPNKSGHDVWRVHTDRPCPAPASPDLCSAKREDDLMKLYGAPKPAPNPRRVRMFLAEKGIDLPETPIDMSKREHKSAEYRQMNSLGQVPTLLLDDGTAISETVAICRYFEEIQPEPSLFGRTAAEKANVDLWVRRLE